MSYTSEQIIVAEPPRMSAFEGKADMPFCIAHVGFLSQSGHSKKGLHTLYSNSFHRLLSFQKVNWVARSIGHLRLAADRACRTSC
jgi:hypothetical protein